MAFEIKNVKHRNFYIQEQFPCCYLLPYIQRSFSDVTIFAETLVSRYQVLKIILAKVTRKFETCSKKTSRNKFRRL